jgi:hypothetical protein
MNAVVRAMGGASEIEAKQVNRLQAAEAIAPTNAKPPD